MRRSFAKKLPFGLPRNWGLSPLAMRSAAGPSGDSLRVGPALRGATDPVVSPPPNAVDFVLGRDAYTPNDLRRRAALGGVKPELDSVANRFEGADLLEHEAGRARGWQATIARR